MGKLINQEQEEKEKGFGVSDGVGGGGRRGGKMGKEVMETIKESLCLQFPLLIQAFHSNRLELLIKKKIRHFLRN